MKKYNMDKMNNLEKYGFEELKKEGLFDKDLYDGMIGEAVMELLKVFSKQNHSGYSAMIVRGLFSKLSNYKPLNNKITNNKDEWIDVGPFYQSKKEASIFTNDMKYYYNIDDKPVKWYKRLFIKHTKISKLPLYKIKSKGGDLK